MDHIVDLALLPDVFLVGFSSVVFLLLDLCLDKVLVLNETLRLLLTSLSVGYFRLLLHL